MNNKLLTYISAIFSFFLIACSDEDTFSTSYNNVLSFETDTLSLDTCFSSVPTPHKLFYVYNKSEDGIRISSARLESGNQTGFRVNVNGTYLGDTNGYQTRDMELRKGDSLRVFVELTSHENGDSLPVLVDDNLIFTLENGRVQKINLNAWSWDAILLDHYYVGGDSVTTLTNEHGKPVVIYGNIFVDSLATLLIPAGTTLYFHNNSGIDVKGTLKINGEKDNEVTLRCDRLDWMVSNLTYDNNPGQWGGIYFYPNSYDNEIVFADIHACTTAIKCDSSQDVTREKLTLKNSTLHNAKGDGIYSVNSNLTIENCQISNTFGNCIYVRGGKVNVNHCTIAQYFPFDARRGPALYFTNGINGYACPLVMNINNSILKGYADDVVLWSHGGTEDSLEVKFDHCIVRTTPGEDYSYMFENCILEQEPEDTLTLARNSFVLFDTDYFHYDFTPLPNTSAIGTANPDTSLPYDRKGRERSITTPDVGCYETIKETENP